ncbi:hypothetical protein [Cohnella silvisoli]|uniref:DUF3850 domain-containing protein n=1 Tax=Cohnella silvisoli TaxID=2873699 RepID=A0ABV1L0X5_9BACL|nr:hypothetical protein [Cohnella silvisoli]MCD9025375.1 hypothetical protein [Cohnella silvisoli]
MEATKENGVNYYPPQDEYRTFEDDEDYAVKGRNWGLFGKAPKKQFWHKNSTTQSLVTIKGYQEYKVLCLLVIEFENGNLSCIHPSYLKEMQSGNFGKELVSEEVELTEGISSLSTEPEADITEAPPARKQKSAEKPAPKKQKEQKEKIDLPVDKVKFSAKVKEFATKPNPFSDNDDEVLLFEEVVILNDPPLAIGDAWCGYSNTLKALGLELGNMMEFEGKIVDKKFNKEIIYKVNNPSKITKI